MNLGTKRFITAAGDQGIDIFIQTSPQEAFKANAGIFPWLGCNHFLLVLPSSSLLYSLDIDNVIKITHSTESNLCGNVTLFSTLLLSICNIG